MTTKLWVHLVLAGILLVLAAGVGSAEPVELSFAAHWSSGPQYDLLQKYIEEYNAMQSDVKVQYIQSEGFAQAVNEQFLLASSTGLAPDIVHVPSRSLVQYGSLLGLLVPPPPALVDVLQDKFLPGALALTTVRGVLYGPATENQMHGMALNGVVFDNAGVATDPPTSWSELAAVARRLRRVSADGQVEVAGIEMVAARTILSMAWSNGAKILNEANTEFTLTSDAWHETIQYLADLVKTDAAIIGSGSEFDHEKAGIKLGAAPWMRGGYINRSGEASYARLVSAPLPAGKTGEPASEQWGYALTVSSSSKHPDKAWKFIEWLTTKETERGTTRMGDVMAALGSIPNTYIDLENQPARNEQYLAGFGNIVADGYTRTLNSAPPIGADIRNTISEQVLPALNSEMSVQNALIEAQRVLQASLDEYIRTSKQ